AISTSFLPNLNNKTTSVAMNQDYISLTSLPHSLNLMTLVSRLRRVKSKALPCKASKTIVETWRATSLLFRQYPHVKCFVFGAHFIFFILFLNFVFYKARALLLTRRSLETTPSRYFTLKLTTLNVALCY
ncbi:MAG: hypothetical protein LBK97_07635, partial [Prevotellaceae bacterium]|nr:hypothetical protein [Prevotellaceae bacterium]